MSEQEQPKRMEIHMPSDLEPVYSNLTLVSNTDAEFILDFVLALPRQQPQGRIAARVLMSPKHILLLKGALEEHVAKYEEAHGPIATAPIPVILDPTRDE